MHSLTISCIPVVCLIHLSFGLPLVSVQQNRSKSFRSNMLCDGHVNIHSSFWQQISIHVARLDSRLDVVRRVLSALWELVVIVATATGFVHSSEIAVVM